MVDELIAATIVFAHAGAGPVVPTSPGSGGSPVVVRHPHPFGNAKGDHQAPAARELGQSGHIVVTEDPATLDSAIDAAQGGRARSLQSSPLQHDLLGCLVRVLADKERRKR
jgi:UDP-N-acetylglucosamine transferase subunit ALG13